MPSTDACVSASFLFFLPWPSPTAKGQGLVATLLEGDHLMNIQEQACLQGSATVKVMKVVTVDRKKLVAKTLQQFVSAIVNI